MALQPGTRLGVYEVQSAIGAGGMGEVYRARDTRLHRDVALKILPEAFASDAERLARFEREAQVLASLNHPHIAAIHGLEESAAASGPGSTAVYALVLELVEGDTLADVIAGAEGSRGLPLDEAVAIARQIADALEAAHEQGVIHRDLKPANIKVRPDGTVKVLDFGLAKLVAGSAVGGRPDVSMSPTITTPAMTMAGMIMGTAAYMSPEQARGREADKRSDVWAFGAVLFEMLTGTRAFDDAEMSDTLASVIKSEPDWTRLPPDTPPALRTLVQRCLTKDRRQRIADISAAKFVLNEWGQIGAPPASTTSSSIEAPRSRWQWPLAAGAGAVATAIVIGAAAWALWPTPPSPRVTPFAFKPDGQIFSGISLSLLALSDDGTRMAYTADGRIYLRPFGELDSHAIPGIEGTALNPVFSPDGGSIAYLTVADGLLLKRIPITGGSPVTVATFGAIPSYSGLSWSREGILLTSLTEGILRVASNGGKPEKIISVAPDEVVHGARMLPDGQTVLFTLAKNSNEDRWDTAQIVAQSLKDGTRRVLIEGGADARYVKTGHLLYVVGGTVYAVPFDVGALAVTGPAVQVLVGVRRAVGGQLGTAVFEVSASGTLAYAKGPATMFSAPRGLALGDGKSEPSPLKVPPAIYEHPRVSPDGTVLAVGRSDGPSSDIWLYELSGTSEIRRLTFGRQSRLPVWSADGKRATFQSNREDARGIWWQPVEGGTEERLTTAAQDEEHVPESWSRDGTKLLFSIRKRTLSSLWVFTRNGGKIERVGKVESAESLSASFSPDGRWVAYSSTERAGAASSPNRGVFVEPYPATGEKHQAPKLLLDYHPVWAPDGKSIYFVPGASRSLVSVPVTMLPTPNFGTPVPLPKAIPGLLSLDVRGYDVLTDGRILSVSGANGSGAVPPVDITVVLNWFEELKRLAPSK